MNNDFVPNQRHFIRQLSEIHKAEFNNELFERNDYEIIEALKSTILSCQRDKYFTIRVEKFSVIEDYAEINRILYEYNESNRPKKNNKYENPYGYINMKDSDVMLLIVDYVIRIKDGDTNPYDTMKVILMIPRIVDRYYYRIYGNLYSAAFQIVDGSTYNNSSAASKHQNVTMKTIFMPIRLYRNTGDITDFAGRSTKYTVYASKVFNKVVHVLLYFFAKFGLEGTIEFLGLKYIRIRDQYTEEDGFYSFEKNGIFVNVPIEIFDNDIPTQCFIMTLLLHINKYTRYEDIINIEHWQEYLSVQFMKRKPKKYKSASKQKTATTTGIVIDKTYALALLDSLESIYDIDTHNALRLPEEDKHTIYHVIRWMIREFQQLRLKDNLDISTKRVRRAERIAASYAMKVSKGIYRASDMQKNITIKDIKRYINVDPAFILKEIARDKLCNFRNAVNDTDAMVALKYSYKGLSGIGENGSSIPDKYRQVHYSHLGKVDIDTSSAGDPGIAGILCPMAKLYDNAFSDYEEPNSWEEEFNTLVNNYRATVGRLELITIHNVLGEIFDTSSLESASIEALKMCKHNQEIAMVQMITLLDNAEEINCDETEDGTLIMYKA